MANVNIKKKEFLNSIKCLTQDGEMLNMFRNNWQGREDFAKTFIIPFHGEINFNNWWDGVDADGFCEVLNELAKEAEIIIIEINSPGGDPIATSLITAKIKKLTESGIEFIAYISGEALSGAYAVANECAAIFLAHNLCVIGSIGAYFEFRDFSEKYKKEGISVIEVYSQYSAEKNLAIRKALEGDFSEIEKEADKIALMFREDVIRNRGIDADSIVFKGNHYYSEEAILLKLADGIIDLEKIIF